MPPAEISITAIAYEFKIIANTDRRPIDLKIFKPDLVRRLLVVPGKLERRHPCLRFAAIFGCARWALPDGRATAPLRISQLKEPAGNFNHAADPNDRWRRRP